MFATALIVFREVLEASLIISIIMAATRGVPRRGAWVMSGVGLGAVGAGVIAGLINIIAGLFDGSGQEVVNAIILFSATAMIGWHIVWMSQHGRALASDMKKVGAEVSHGTKSLSVLTIVIGLAVMREGSEVVLMLQGLWASGAIGSMLGGAVLGFVAGIFVGVMLYIGFIALPVGRIFAMTNWLLILIAAGMAARGANFLEQASMLPGMGGAIWDSSAILSEDSIVGKIMTALTGYIARPNAMQLSFYVLTIGAIVTTMRLVTPRRPTARVKGGLVATVAILAVLGTAAESKALEVLSPYITKGEMEIEHQGLVTHDSNPDASNEQTYTASAAYTPTNWYKGEIETEFEREAGMDTETRYSSVNLENWFKLSEDGEYWLDPALFYEMDFARQGPNDIKFGVIAAKQMGAITTTANVLLHKNYGDDETALGFAYSNQTKYRLREWAEPGVEIYGDTDGKNGFDHQQFSAGPGLFGKIHIADGHALKYQAAYLFGATTATANRSVRWKLEYEFAF